MELRQIDVGVGVDVDVDVGGASVLDIPCFAAGAYSGVAKAALVAFKHRGAFGLVKPLGRRLAVPLARACAEASHDPPLVVTMPSRAKRVRERGYRHVEELVRAASVQRETFELARVLRPLRGRTGQVGLDVRAREENAKRIAVRRLWAPDVRGREVILVDDIVTTGATVRAAQEVLEEAGARVIAVVALCIAVRRDTPRTSTGNRT